MATPCTMHDHLNTPEGAIYGFAMLPPKSLPRQLPRTIETAVEGLWISSAYTGFGGFTGAIGAGIAAARSVLGRNLGHRKRIRFAHARKPCATGTSKI